MVRPPQLERGTPRATISRIPPASPRSSRTLCPRLRASSATAPVSRRLAQPGRGMLFRGVGPIPSEAQGRQTVLRRGSSADSGSPRLEGGMGDRFWSSGEQVERLWPLRPKMSARSRAASSPCGAPLGPVRGPGRPWSPRGPSAVASCAGRDRRSSLAPSEPGPSRGRGRRAPDRQHAPHGASRGGKPLKGGPRPRAIGRDLGAGLNS